MTNPFAESPVGALIRVMNNGSSQVVPVMFDRVCRMAIGECDALSSTRSGVAAAGVTAHRIRVI